MVTKEMRKWSKKDMKTARKILDFFNMLGLKDEDLDKLVYVLRNWDKIVEITNRHSEDLMELRRSINNEAKDDVKANTGKNIIGSTGIASEEPGFIFGKVGKKG